jgi:tripartite-type tricarboxylate transporter receptor subunit TctC
VPYRGAALAMNDLIAGNVPILFDNLPIVIPQVQAGTVRALAVASPNRLSSLPDVPTFEEAGLVGFEASSWFGYWRRRERRHPIKVTADIERAMSSRVRKASSDRRGSTVFGPDGYS